MVSITVCPVVRLALARFVPAVRWFLVGFRLPTVGGPVGLIRRTVLGPVVLRTPGEDGPRTDADSGDKRSSLHTGCRRTLP
ncbi:hypothetical protein C491_16927 [Natronococcus amylolyticus DSM 10524]|uniref:Uncharacterized protein n=1 Tax=Natronococcus amylolyticus DSM 10524 TaxID=1227497 RepID=L9X1C7_9EURY|nr:hypothetical protein C491_16927 [Natronococcus amylolyticus DSM 10524]